MFPMKIRLSHLWTNLQRLHKLKISFDLIKFRIETFEEWIISKNYLKKINFDLYLDIDKILLSTPPTQVMALICRHNIRTVRNWCSLNIGPFFSLLHKAEYMLLSIVSIYQYFYQVCWFRILDLFLVCFGKIWIRFF